MAAVDSVTVLEAEISVDTPGALENDLEYYRTVLRRLVRLREYIFEILQNTHREFSLTRLGVALEESEVNATYHGNLERSSALRRVDHQAMIQELQSHCHTEMHHRVIRVTVRLHYDQPVPEPSLANERLQVVKLQDEEPRSTVVDAFHVQSAVTAQQNAVVTGATITFQDEGKGFNPGDVPDPTLEENLEIPSGRGLLLIRTFTDEVTFNAAGNEISIRKNTTGKLVET